MHVSPGNKTTLLKRLVRKKQGKALTPDGLEERQEKRRKRQKEQEDGEGKEKGTIVPTAASVLSLGVKCLETHTYTQKCRKRRELQHQQDIRPLETGYGLVTVRNSGVVRRAAKSNFAREFTWNLETESRAVDTPRWRRHDMTVDNPVIYLGHRDWMMMIWHVFLDALSSFPTHISGSGQTFRVKQKRTRSFQTI